MGSHGHMVHYLLIPHTYLKVFVNRIHLGCLQHSQSKQEHRTCLNLKREIRKVDRSTRVNYQPRFGE